MACQEGLTTIELEFIRESPSRLWHYYCSDPCFEEPKSALLHLMEITKVFDTEFQELGMELRQNMLPFIENTLSLIRFMTNSFDDLNHTSVDALNKFHDDIVSVSRNLERIAPSEVEDQLLRIDTDFGAIVAALELIKRREKSGTGNITQADGGSGAWQPFFSSPNRFKTDDEKDFITNLRGLYLRVRDITSSEILKELMRIFESTPTGTLTFSLESSRDTALRSVLTVLSALRRQSGKDYDFAGLGEIRKDRLVSSFNALSSATSAQNPTKSSANNRNLCRVRWQFMTSLIHPISEYKPFPRSTTFSTVFEPEPDPAAYTISALWRKLRKVKSVDEILANDERRCSICLAEDITALNFAIMDSCIHIFCKHCIEDWFKSCNSCPNCRTKVRSWTTKNGFSKFLEQNSTVIKPSQLEAGASTNGAVEPPLPESGDSINRAVKPSLPEAVDSTNTAVEQSQREAGDSTNRDVDPSQPEAGDSTNRDVGPSQPEAGDSTNRDVDLSQPEAGDSTNRDVDPSQPKSGDSKNDAVEPSQSEEGDSKVALLPLE